MRSPKTKKSTKKRLFDGGKRELENPSFPKLITETIMIYQSLL